MDYHHFDTRGYPTRSVADGYREWAPTYEQTVPDELDIRLLDRIESIEWSSMSNAVDLACGTGRTGSWLKQHGVRTITGVDLTPTMLEIARAKNIYNELLEGDVCKLPLEDDTFDLAIMSLADEHLSDLCPLYHEAARVTHDAGHFVIVGYHSHFLMLGIPTHFQSDSGESLTIESYIHLTSDHVRAARAFGWSLHEMHEGVIDEQWATRKPKWRQYLHHPVSFTMVWHKSAATAT